MQPISVGSEDRQTPQSQYTHRPARRPTPPRSRRPGSLAAGDTLPPSLPAPPNPRPPPGGDGGRLRLLLPRRGSGPRRPDQRPGSRRLLQGLRPPAASSSAGKPQISPPQRSNSVPRAVRPRRSILCHPALPIAACLLTCLLSVDHLRLVAHNSELQWVPRFGTCSALLIMERRP